MKYICYTFKLIILDFRQNNNKKFLEWGRLIFQPNLKINNFYFYFQ